MFRNTALSAKKVFPLGKILALCAAMLFSATAFASTLSTCPRPEEIKLASEQPSQDYLRWYTVSGWSGSSRRSDIGERRFIDATYTETSSEKFPDMDGRSLTCRYLLPQALLTMTPPSPIFTFPLPNGDANWSGPYTQDNVISISKIWTCTHNHIENCKFNLKELDAKSKLSSPFGKHH